LNILRFIRTFEQYIEEIRPDSTTDEVIGLLRDFFADTMNFVHRQVQQISALCILVREVLFAYGAIEKQVGVGYIPSRLNKVLVPDKDEYAILADVCYALLRMRPLSISCAEYSVAISCGKVDYDKSG
jgi:hypothetical protein